MKFNFILTLVQSWILLNLWLINFTLSNFHSLHLTSPLRNNRLLFIFIKFIISLWYNRLINGIHWFSYDCFFLLISSRLLNGIHWFSNNSFFLLIWSTCLVHINFHFWVIRMLNIIRCIYITLSYCDWFPQWIKIILKLRLILTRHKYLKIFPTFFIAIFAIALYFYSWCNCNLFCSQWITRYEHLLNLFFCYFFISLFWNVFCVTFLIISFNCFIMLLLLIILFFNKLIAFIDELSLCLINFKF